MAKFPKGKYCVPTGDQINTDVRGFTLWKPQRANHLLAMKIIREVVRANNEPVRIEGITAFHAGNVNIYWYQITFPYYLKFTKGKKEGTCQLLRRI